MHGHTAAVMVLWTALQPVYVVSLQCQGTLEQQTCCPGKISLYTSKGASSSCTPLLEGPLPWHQIVPACCSTSFGRSVSTPYLEQYSALAYIIVST